MKNILKFSLLLILAAAFTGCDDDKSYEDPGLDVSLYNISGTWKLESWSNGTPARRRKLCSISNSPTATETNSPSTRISTASGLSAHHGRIQLYTDESLGSVIRGMSTTKTETGRTDTSSATSTATA